MRKIFDSCKVRIPDKETSKKVQERLFELGYEPYNDDTNKWCDWIEGYIIHPSHKTFHRVSNNTFEDYDSHEEVSVADIIGLETVGYIPGTFAWAVDMMKQGKKVRRKGYLGNGNGVMKIHRKGTLTKTKILNEGCNIYWSPTVDDIEATDWEIFEEPKTLWDKRIDIEKEKNIPSGTYRYRLDGKDVKDAFKIYRQRVWDEVFSHSAQQIKEGKIAEEELGKELVE